MEQKYRALRTIGNIYKVLGGITAAITILLVAGLCLTSVLGGAAANQVSRSFGGSGAGGLLGGLLGGILLSLIAIIYGGGIALTLFAAGEGIFLLIALEENTRATTRLLREQSAH